MLFRWTGFELGKSGIAALGIYHKNIILMQIHGKAFIEFHHVVCWSTKLIVTIINCNLLLLPTEDTQMMRPRL